MKNIMCFAVVVVSINAYAVSQAPEVMPGPAKGSIDRMLMVGAHEMPLPPPQVELRKTPSTAPMNADESARAIENAPDRVRQFMSDLETVKGHQSSAADATEFADALISGKAVPTAPVIVKNLSDLKLRVNTAAIRSGKLIGAAPQGTIINGAWTGVERYFRIEGSGYSRVSETNLAASGGMFYMNKAAVNTTVGGKPAISAVFTDEKGNRVEEVLWVAGDKLFKVTYAPDQQSGRYGMMKSNSAVSALSLAAELR